MIVLEVRWRLFPHHVKPLEAALSITIAFDSTRYWRRNGVCQKFPVALFLFQLLAC